jgi:hypothetical protein
MAKKTMLREIDDNTRIVLYQKRYDNSIDEICLLRKVKTFFGFRWKIFASTYRTTHINNTIEHIIDYLFFVEGKSYDNTINKLVSSFRQNGEIIIQNNEAINNSDFRLLRGFND